MPAPTALTPAEHAMLGLVALRPRHGYEIAAHFTADGDLGIVCQIPMSLLYAQLKRGGGPGRGGGPPGQGAPPPATPYLPSPSRRRGGVPGLARRAGAAHPR